METIDQVILNAETSDQFIRQLMSSLILSTKTSNAIPLGEGSRDFEYYSTFPTFNKESNDTSLKVARKIQDISSFISSSNSIDLPDDLTDSSLYEQVVDVIDTLLEAADLTLDEASGTGRNSTSSLQLSLAVDKERLISSNVKDVPKSQLTFLTEIDNKRDTPFYPRLKSKVHASCPIDLNEHRLIPTKEDDILVCKVYYAHPYEKELEQLGYISPGQLEEPTSIPAVITPPVAQPFLFVDTKDCFERLLDELDGEIELAVDLEHHSYRTFQGITCLMQLSTRSKNYIIDTIALRRYMNELIKIFADPKVVKIFHGCDSDILWLQRDFGLYVVNCFDTFQAAKILKYPALSLAHLLKLHCGVTLNKKHQLSDWRQRPLPEEMINYARDDTHYLLHVYDIMRRTILRQHGHEGLRAVLDASRRTCMRRYEKEQFRPDGYLRLLQLASVKKRLGQGWLPLTSNKKQFDFEDLTLEQDLCLAALWDWRDRTARALDESLVYIMSNAELLKIGMTVPRDETSLRRDCGPISATVSAKASEIIEMIRSRLEGGATNMPAAAVAPSTKATVQPPKLFEEVVMGTAFSSDTARRDLVGLRRYNGTEADSVFTFTHSVPTTPAASARLLSPTHGFTTSSPVMGTDEVFRFAGWRTPAPMTHSEQPEITMQEMTSLQSPLAVPEPLRTSVIGNEDVSEDTKRRLEKAMEGLRQGRSRGARGWTETVSKSSVAEVPALLTAGASETAPSTQATESEDLDNETAGGNAGSLLAVPRSLVEIYDISNRNRKRNRNKKKQSGRGDGDNDDEVDDGDGGIESSDAQQSATQCGEEGEMAGADTTADSCYLGGEETDSGIDNTLDFLSSCGWLSNEPRERLAVIEAHLLEQAHGSETAGQDDAQSKVSSSGAVRKAPLTPPKGSLKHPPSPVRTSGISANQASGQGKPQVRQQQPIPTLGSQLPPPQNQQGFDFSRQSLSAMGAMGGGQNQGREASSSHRANPFLGGGSGGSASGPRGSGGGRKGGSGGGTYGGRRPN